MIVGRRVTASPSPVGVSVIRNVAQSRESYFRANTAASGNLANSRKLLSPSNSSSLSPTAAAKAAKPPFDAAAPSPLSEAPGPIISPARSPSASPPPTPPDAHTADGALPVLRVPPPLNNTAYLCQAPHSATILEPASTGERRSPFPGATGRTTPPFGSGALSAPFGDGEAEVDGVSGDDPDDTITLAAALEAKAKEDETEDPGDAPVLPVEGDTEGTEVGGSRPSGEGVGALRRRMHSGSGAVSGGSSGVEVTARFGAVPPGGPGTSVGTPGVIHEEEEVEEAEGPQGLAKAAQEAEASHAADVRLEASALSVASHEHVELEGHGPFSAVPLEPLPDAYSVCILVCHIVP